MIERCRNCQSMLIFVGFDRRRRRVLQCPANLSMVETRDGIKTHSSTPCNFDYVVEGGSFKNAPQWFARVEDDEERGPRESMGRCRDHGLEPVSMRRKRAEAA